MSGEQQMVAVGRALLSPKILMLDEPSLGLSPLLCSELFKALTDIRETGVVSCWLSKMQSRVLP